MSLNVYLYTRFKIIYQFIYNHKLQLIFIMSILVAEIGWNFMG